MELLAKAGRVLWLGAVALMYTFIAFMSVTFASKMCSSYLAADPSEWNAVLPKMNEMWLPAFGMYVHWIGGVVILGVGLVQLFPFMRRKSTLWLHRVLGNLYVLAAIVTSLGGNLFIYTVPGGCVGGTNMSIAFSIAGWVMFFLAAATYYHARMHNVTKHRDFAIRLWGQGIASLMYRIWYMLLGIFLGYEVTGFEDFHRPLDEALDWWFFVPNLVVTEVVVWCLHRRDAKLAASREHQQQHPEQQPMLGDTEDEQAAEEQHPATTA